VVDFCNHQSKLHSCWDTDSWFFNDFARVGAERVFFRGIGLRPMLVDGAPWELGNPVAGCLWVISILNPQS